jgi:hypothetical protein
LTTIDVRSVRTDPEERRDRAGAGLAVAFGGAAEVLRGLFDENRLTGILAADAESLRLDEVLVRGTLATESDSRFGRGLHVEGGSVSIANSQFIRNADVSVAMFGENTTATLDHVYVGDTLERACVELPEGDPNRCVAGRGYGLGAYDGASIAVEDVVVSESASVGVQVAGGRIMGSGLSVRDCPVGLNLQSLPDGYDWESAVSGLVLEGNGMDLDESEMSVAEALPE